MSAAFERLVDSLRAAFYSISDMAVCDGLNAFALSMLAEVIVTTTWVDPGAALILSFC
jgi:hypothetical protein